MEQRNVILAIVLSVAIIVGWQLMFPSPPPVERDAGAESQTLERQGGAPEGLAPPSVLGAAPSTAATPGVPSLTKPAFVPPSRAAVIARTERLPIRTPRVTGSISTKGARIDDLILTDYRETIEPDSPRIALLSPEGTIGAFYADFGWASGDSDAPMPNSDTVWTPQGRVLKPDSPITLTWDNGGGLRFSRQISIDEDFLVKVIQRVKNTGSKSVTLYPWGRVARTGIETHGGTDVPMAGTYVHRGPAGVFDGKLVEANYEGSSWFSSALDLQEMGTYDIDATGGWLGIKEQYWLVALIPDKKFGIKANFRHIPRDKQEDRYLVSYIADKGFMVAPGQSVEVTNRVFAGAKELRLLDRYEEELDIEDFHMAIDYTKIYFLTIPLHKLLLFFSDNIPNYGVSILLLTVMIKILFFPLANKSYKSMSRLKKLQPKMVEIRDRFKDDRARQNQEMMALYKKENANPASGCLPILVQIPVFISLYIVLFVTIEMRHAPFFGWIQDLSAPDPLGLLTLFGLIRWDVPEMLGIVNVGIWPLIMGLTMFLQQRLNPQPADPMQAKIFMMLPIVFTFLLGRFPAGLVIYWAWNNTLSMAQQWLIMRRMGVGASGQATKITPPSGPPRPAKSATGKAKSSAGNAKDTTGKAKDATGKTKAATGKIKAATGKAKAGKKKAGASGAPTARRKNAGRRRRSSKSTKGAV